MTLPDVAPPDQGYRLPAPVLAPAISLIGVSKYFYKRGNRITALSDVSLHIARGSFVSIVGKIGWCK